MKIALFFLVLSLLHVSSIAVKQSYIVYMGAHSHPENATMEVFDRVTDSHHEFLATFLGSLEEARDAIIYSYTMHINGFSAILEEHHAAEIAKHQDVISVIPDKVMELHTTHSWDFMSLENNDLPSVSWKKEARFGEDTIIGNLDTGVWPESESFSDVGYGPIPSRWKGSCENSNNTAGVHCNRKLIGAKCFNKGYKASGGSISKSMESARDYNGHGSHTLSTAGGNFVPGVSINGIPFGTAKGGSPRARVASYKVCWSSIDGRAGCLTSDLLAGFDMAIQDGVDVVSISVGGTSSDYFDDVTAIGAFHAFQKGIVVVCSGGNSGPYSGSVTNVAPWIITVAASTMDREVQCLLNSGSSLSQALPKDTQYPLISAADAKLANASANDAALYCMEGTLDEKKVKDKILVCLRGITERLDKGLQAKRAGAAGMILCNDESHGNQTTADLQVLPATNINFQDGLALLNYINSTQKPTAYLTAPKQSFGVKPAPRIAEFSSRGPNPITPEILKPDITAPGVDVIAAYSPAVSLTGIPDDDRKVSFMIDTGTSMSCPHISGIAGLLRTMHPTWSPAAIKSAIMTTARTRDNTINPMGDEVYGKATPFGYGAGHVRPNRAMNPGLIYDLTTTDYLHFLCALGYNETKIETLYNGQYKCSNSTSSINTILNLNYPSITVPNLSDSTTVTRTVTNVGSPGVYVARVRQPSGVSITVKPKELKFEKNGEKKKGIHLDVADNALEPEELKKLDFTAMDEDDLAAAKELLFESNFVNKSPERVAEVSRMIDRKLMVRVADLDTVDFLLKYLPTVIQGNKWI
uniref:Uncharacterized protein n=1 Tax=Chenopodium quinoa TaxID=63459 RepID=A0A803M0K5_CHEQI